MSAAAYWITCALVWYLLVAGVGLLFVWLTGEIWPHE